VLLTAPNWQTNVLFDRHEICWKRWPIDPVKISALRGQRIDNPDLFNTVKARVDAHAAVLPHTITNHLVKQPIAEVHDKFGWWLCCQDHFIDDTHVYEAAKERPDYSAKMIWLKKDAPLTVVVPYTHWKVCLTPLDMELADQTAFPNRTQSDGTFHRHLRGALTKTMEERADVLMAQQTNPALLPTRDDCYMHLFRNGYIVTTGIDSPLNHHPLAMQGRGHMTLTLAGTTVYIVKYPRQSPLPVVTPPVIDEASRAASITATTSLHVRRTGHSVLVYRPYRWFVEHG